MPLAELITIILIFLMPVVIIIWAVKKRRRLFYNVHFTAHTIWSQYQNQDKKNAIELADYQKEEKEAGGSEDFFDKNLT